MPTCLSPTLSLHGFPEWGTGHTYQLLDRRLNLSLFSTPDTYGGPRDRKIEFSEGITFWSQGQTSLLPRQRPPRALTSPIFPRFLGKEAIVTLRRDAGYRGERSMIRKSRGEKGVTSSVRCLPPRSAVRKQRRIRGKITFRNYFPAYSPSLPALAL